MRILVVGSGGREHALAWKLAQSPGVSEVLVAPGNGGIASVDRARSVPVAADDIPGLVALARTEAIDLVVPGGEVPLTLGLADACAAAGIACFGPTRAAARLEGSKAFMKEIAAAAGIPTARSAVFDDLAAARAHLAAHGAPVVAKADGLAAGKGVVVATTLEEAQSAADSMLAAPGSRIVIEECLTGPELSLFALCDGTTALPFGAARDHKRAHDGDEGPNTGGMGAFSPVAGFDDVALAQLTARFIQPALAELQRRGTPFRGALFAGLMLTPEGPKLLEFNVRFGDPECQALMLRFDGDLALLLDAACHGRLATCGAPFRAEAAVVVVMAAAAYPAGSAAGEPIRILPSASDPDAVLFHAGTRIESDRLLAVGGRVLNLCGIGRDLAQARAAAYRLHTSVIWPGGRVRSDIAHGKVALPASGS